MGRSMLNRLWRRVLIELLRPFVLIGVGIEKVYNFAFWKSNVRLSMENEKRLACDIAQSIPFLFREYAGVFVPIDSIEEPVPKSLQHPRPFDYAVVVVAVEDLLFRFIRGRGDIGVQVTKQCDPTNWGELQWVLSMVDGPDLFEPRDFSSLEDIANLLKPRMARIKELFSVDRYPDTKHALSDMRSHERAVARQLASEISRTLQD